MRRAGHELAHQQAVARARLVHEHRRRRARAVEVQHDAHPVGPRVLAQEGARPEQAALLSVGEEEDHVVARPPPRGQRAGRLEQRDDAAAIVGGAGGHGHRVVVGHEQDGARGVAARQAGDHVTDRARHAAALRRHRRGGLQVRRQVEGVELGGYGVSRPRGAVGAYGPGSGGDLAQEQQGAAGRKAVGRAPLRRRRRHAERGDAHHDQRRDDGHDERRKQGVLDCHGLRVAAAPLFATSRGGPRGRAAARLLLSPPRRTIHSGRARRGASGALYPQSATAGLNPRPRGRSARLSAVSRR